MKLNEKLLAKFATDYTTSDKEGILWKKGEVNKGFQKRFFVLRGNFLFYFEKKQDSEPIGVIILENCRIELSPSDSYHFAFQIVFEGVGTRKYVLGAETENDMKSWMTKLTHAGHFCIQTIVSDLEQRLADLQRKEASMTPKVISEPSSESENEESNEDPTEEPSMSSNQQTLSIALPKPANNTLPRSKSRTLPPRRASNRQVHEVLNSSKTNRWSLSTSYPESFDGKKTLGIDNLANFSDRTDFLCEEIPQTGRHFSMTAFTPPSFSELKNHEEIEDQNLIDLLSREVGIPMDKKLDAFTLPHRTKGSKRAKSERHRIKRGGHVGAKRGVSSGSVYSHLKKDLSDESTLLDENRDSKFQHLHRRLGATIWTKVREYELQVSKHELECSLND